MDNRRPAQLLWGNIYAQRMKNCATYLRTWYSNTRCPSRIQGALTADRVRPSGEWPKLRAKAAQTRHIARFALPLMQTFGSINSLEDFVKLHDRLALGVIQQLVRFYQLLDENPKFATAEAQDELATVGNTMEMLCSRLSRVCYDRGLRL